MLPLVARIPAMRLNPRASLQLLKRGQSISISQRSAAERQRQALIRGGIALVAIGGTGYILNKVISSPSMLFDITENDVSFFLGSE